MIVNTEILDEYLTEKSLDGVKNHWIFNSIVEGQYLFEKRPDLLIDFILNNKSLD
ncbi:MAG: hypothetical protein ACREV6_01250 [Clostridium sp.]|uniref:hypothetical protein n=1 Tax=Clostridium sp. TaxID=1506 RepID=UPI003D6CDDA3